MKTNTAILAAALALLSLAAPAKDNPAAVTHVDAGQAAKLVQEKKVTVLDIRTPDEFKEGRIAGAVNIDFNGKSFEAEIAKLDKSKPYLVH